MVDIARQTVEFLYEENGGIPRDLYLPTIEDIKDEANKFTIDKVRKGTAKLTHWITVIMYMMKVQYEKALHCSVKTFPWSHLKAKWTDKLSMFLSPQALQWSSGAQIVTTPTAPQEGQRCQSLPSGACWRPLVCTELFWMWTLWVQNLKLDCNGIYLYLYTDFIFWTDLQKNFQARNENHEKFEVNSVFSKYRTDFLALLILGTFYWPFQKA